MVELLEDRLRGDRRQKRWWTKDWLRRRPIHGQYDALMAAFKNFPRIDLQMFQELLQVVGRMIMKNITWYRQSIEPGVRLADTLRYLATGEQLPGLDVWLQRGVQYHLWYCSGRMREHNCSICWGCYRHSYGA